MRTATTFVFVPSFTPAKVTVILWPVVTPVRFTVTAVVPLPAVPATLPVPEVTVAPFAVFGLLKVTLLGKVNTIW